MRGRNGRRRPRAARARCWHSSASGALCIGARSMRASHTAGSPTPGANRRTPRRVCWTTCTIAACCAWRDAGTRVYAPREPAAELAGHATAEARLDALVDVIVRKCAPLPAASLGGLVRQLRVGTPRHAGELAAALLRARQRLAQARIDGIDWYWPAVETGRRGARRRTRCRSAPGAVRSGGLGSPPLRAVLVLVVSLRGLYAGGEAEVRLPCAALLWREQVVGWANLAADEGGLQGTFGFVAGRPRERAFARELDAELARMRTFLRL